MLLVGHNTTKAADHGQFGGANANEDIADLYGWMTSDGNRVNLVLTVANDTFADGVQYVLHVNSSAGYLMPQTETNIIAQFNAGTLELWVGGDTYVTGDASTRLDGDGVSVFAGLVDDPFFFNGAGFGDIVGFVRANIAGLQFDPDGCVLLDEATRGAAGALLAGTMNGTAPAVDSFAAGNVSAIVVQVDKTLINAGGDILGVWASTHTRQ